MCRCSYDQVQRYMARLSGPVIDRFDIHLQLPPVPVEVLEHDRLGDSSEVVRGRVRAARLLARARGPAPPTTRALARQLEPAARATVLRGIDLLGLSLRAYSKVLRVSRTIADLAGSDVIRNAHVCEALQYRVLDRSQAASALDPGPVRAVPAETG